MTDIVVTLLGGLALFLYAVSNLSGVLKHALGDRTRTIMLRYTGNIYTAIATGTVVTFILDSSSAVIILTIVLVASKLLTFRQSLGIVMGANIGTTLSSQIIALDVAQFSVIPLSLGIAVNMLSRTDHWRMIGNIMTYFGLLFFGLYVMELAVLPLKNSDDFLTWMEQVNNPIIGALAGGLVTLIIQSSSATVGMAITLGKQGLIQTAGGIAVMLGAELGTCSDTLIATLAGNRQALKTGLFHFLFNLLTISIGLLMFEPFVQFILWMSADSGINRQIADAHVMFNVLGVLLFLPFVGPMEKFLNFILPDRKEPPLVAETTAA